MKINEQHIGLWVSGLALWIVINLNVAQCSAHESTFRKKGFAIQKCRLCNGNELKHPWKGLNSYFNLVNKYFFVQFPSDEAYSVGKFECFFFFFIKVNNSVDFDWYLYPKSNYATLSLDSIRSEWQQKSCVHEFDILFWLDPYQSLDGFSVFFYSLLCGVHSVNKDKSVDRQWNMNLYLHCALDDGVWRTSKKILYGCLSLEAKEKMAPHSWTKEIIRQITHWHST